MEPIATEAARVEAAIPAALLRYDLMDWVTASFAWFFKLFRLRATVLAVPENLSCSAILIPIPNCALEPKDNIIFSFHHPTLQTLFYLFHAPQPAQQ